MKLPFILTLTEKPKLTPDLLPGGVPGWRCEGRGAAGLAVAPEVAWAYWFSDAFPTSPHRELVHSHAMLCVLRRRIPVVGKERAAIELTEHLGAIQ